MDVPSKPPSPSGTAESPPILLGSPAPASHFEPGSIPAPPGSKEASVINDGGDTKQLEHIFQQRPDAVSESQPPAGHLLTGPGGPSSRELDRSASPPQLGIGPDATHDYPAVSRDFHSQLVDSIHEAMVYTQWSDTEKDFLPFGKLGELITKAAIECELAANNVHTAHIPEFAAMIGGITPSAASHEKTTRRKLFAILILINKVPAILDLIKESVLDSDLPFVRNTKSTMRKCSLWRRPRDGEGPGPILVESLKLWSASTLKDFHENQWKVLAPFLQLSSSTAPEVHHYPLDPYTILPFIADDAAEGPEAEEIMGMKEFEGGFSEVRKVKIHEHHHNLLDSNASTTEPNPYFAVKILREKTTEEAFWDEATCLKRLMEANNLNLVRLLGTFKYRGRYHLIFPWADANLEDFWERRYPDPARPLRNVELTRWMARELYGLASGLQLVHSSPILKDNKQKLAPVSQKIYGRHGDIKPTNILWFRAARPGGPEGDMGLFKIADFGFTAFHSKDSVEQPAHLVGRSPTHRAPECDGLANVSPSSDFWSLGAVLLEFVVWYIHGLRGWKLFADRRAADDIGSPLVKEDKYFNEVFSGDSPSANKAKIKQCVPKEISNLRNHERCSPFLNEVLDFIEKRLLVVDEQDRAKCDELVKTFGDLEQKCRESSSFCMGKEKDGSRDGDESHPSAVSVGLEASSKPNGAGPPSRWNSWKLNKRATGEARDRTAHGFSAPAASLFRRWSSWSQCSTPPAAAASAVGPGAPPRSGGWAQAQQFLGKRKSMDDHAPCPTRGGKMRRRSSS